MRPPKHLSRERSAKRSNCQQGDRRPGEILLRLLHWRGDLPAVSPVEGAVNHFLSSGLSGLLTDYLKRDCGLTGRIEGIISGQRGGGPPAGKAASTRQLRFGVATRSAAIVIPNTLPVRWRARQRANHKRLVTFVTGLGRGCVWPEARIWLKMRYFWGVSSRSVDTGVTGM